MEKKIKIGDSVCVMIQTEKGLEKSAPIVVGELYTNPLDGIEYFTDETGDFDIPVSEVVEVIPKMEITHYISKENVISIAQTIFKQILLSVGKNVYFSWGCDTRLFVEINGKAGLCLHVNGFCLSGWVVVLLNGGADLYEVYTLKGKRLNLEGLHMVKDGLYCDQLGVLDKIIETGDLTPEEYNEKVQNTYKDILS